MTHLSENRTPTQVDKPWRATVRSVIIASVAILPILPEIAITTGLNEIPVVAQTLAIAAVITRVLALPRVEKWLQDYFPWLSAHGPYEGKHEKTNE